MDEWRYPSSVSSRFPAGGTAQRAAPKAAILVPRKGAAASLMRLSLRFTGPRGGPTLMLPEDPADPSQARLFTCVNHVCRKIPRFLV